MNTPTEGELALRMRKDRNGSTSLFMIGNMKLVEPSGGLISLRARKTRAILAILALAGGERVLRSRLAGLLWDQSNDARARMSLRHALSELNSLVNGRIPGLIEIEREAARLNTEKCWVDVDAPGEHLDQLLQDLDGISPAFDGWLASQRLDFRERQRLSLEEELRQLAEGDAAPGLQAAVARRLVNFDPTHEDAVRHLMTAFANMGDRAQAIREYERFRQGLRDQLGLSPSKETVKVYDAIRRAPSGAEEPRPHYPDTSHAVAPEQGSQPSIAVLPFRNLSVEAGHDYAAEGLVEDLIESLSHVPGFFVISRLSTLAFRGQHRLPREIGEVLDVRYIISGSMRVAGDRLRLTVELTDTQSGAVLWSSKLDERFFDMFEVQGRLAEAIVARVAPHLRFAEVARVSIKRPEYQDASDLLLRAQEHMHNPEQAVFEIAGPLFEVAIDREPRNPMVLAWKAYWHVLRVGQGWSSDRAQDTLEADRLAARAVECGTMEAMAFAVHGHVEAYLHKDFNAAVGSFETALQINPNSARAWLWNAATHAWMGRGAKAVEMVHRALALSPYDPLNYAFSGIAATAYLADRQYARAIEFSLRCMHEHRTYTGAYKTLILALVLSGCETEARAPLHQLLLLEPQFTVQQFCCQSPLCAGPLSELYCEALARVGVPVS
jgi:TolB-like protein/DNA-binding SARP family transcriptional activator